MNPAPLKKMYYSISEVCGQTGLEQHVLRYWETEFPQLKPKKNRAGNRAYRVKEIKMINYIKFLLYHEQYTIQGAKRKLAEAPDYKMPEPLALNRPAAAAAASSPARSILQAVRQELEELLRKLRS